MEQGVGNREGLGMGIDCRMIIYFIILRGVVQLKCFL